MLRNFIILYLFIIFNSILFAQNKVVGVVKDFNTNAGIPYCPVVVKNNQKVNTITNEDGAFMLEASDSDTLQIKYIGYKSKLISVLNLRKTSTIYLIPKDQVLTEVVVRADNDYLYKMMDNCRKVLMKSKTSESKVYFLLDTKIDGKQVELLESYYNGKFTSSRINDLTFKNGRAGMALYKNDTYNHGYFVNINTSKAIAFLSLLTPNELFPSTPLQFNISKLKKNYIIKSGISYGDSLICLEFSPKYIDANLFRGRLYMDKETYFIKKITLMIDTISQHPFETLHNNATIQNLSMEISKTFITKQNQNYLQNVDFSFSINYKKKFYGPLDTTIYSFTAVTKAMMYFYDYNNLFYAPFIKYSDDFDDYMKIGNLSYNSLFWSSQGGLVYSDNIRKAFNEIKKKGYLINYSTTFNTDSTTFFVSSYLPWSTEKRLSLAQNKLQKDTATKYSYGSQPFLSALYNIEAQIFLDVNKKGDSLMHFSVTVFDVFQTFYNLPEDKQTNCFINIYFDLCEIERRKMEQILNSKNYAFTQIDSIYKVSVQHLAKTKSLYMKDVFLGKNKEALGKWNAIVFKELNIDNFLIFKPYE